jgi:hypothetical protein
MLKRWSTALIAVGGLIWTLASCELEPGGSISAAQFHAMLNDVADGGAGFTFDIAELDSEAREEFLAMLPADADIGDGHFLVEAELTTPDEDAGTAEGSDVSEPLFWFWRRTSSTIKWKKSVCYRIYNIDRNAHLSNCPYAGETGPYDFVMRNRHQITGRCRHADARPLNYCDELIYTCRYCGKPRHYRWTYYHERKYKS